MNVEIVPATIEHAVLLAPNLRDSDVRELMASAGHAPLEALIKSVRVSDGDMAWTALVDGVPAVMWGVAPHSNTASIGVVWLLASDLIYQIKKTFLKECPKYITLMHMRYKMMLNYVDIRHTASLIWLDQLGFFVADFQPSYGAGKTPFLLFMSQRN